MVFTGKRTSPASLPTIRHRPGQRVRASRLLICQPHISFGYCFHSQPTHAQLVLKEGAGEDFAHQAEVTGAMVARLETIVDDTPEPGVLGT